MEKKFDGLYWNDRYQTNATGWDIGNVSTPLKMYIDQLSNRQVSILIPGCGNAYEADYLLQQGFADITLIDISPLLIENLKRKYKLVNGNKPNLICDDFFNLKGQYDLIVEQTFFCALNPSLRKKYCEKVHELLKPGGKLVGLLFEKTFIDGPPFGGHAAEYRPLFSPYFHIKNMDACYNSIAPRAGAELFINLVKK